MSFRIDDVMSEINEVLEKHLPDLSTYDEDMEELEELREKVATDEDHIALLEKQQDKLRNEYDLMLIDLIKVNLNHAVLSPHEYVRGLALRVAKEMADSQRNRHEDEVLSASQAAG